MNPSPGAGEADRRGGLATALSGVNRLAMTLGQWALVAACCVLTWSVVVRYAFRAPTDWQDDTAIFLIVGATFLSAAGVQAGRGHVAIEALADLLPPAVDRVRRVVVDLASFVFCAFFGWKSWTLFHEAWVDGQISSSSWGPPLWIPYALMAAGMSLLTLQLGAQTLAGVGGAQKVRPRIGLGAELREDAVR